MLASFRCQNAHFFWCALMICDVFSCKKIGGALWYLASLLTNRVKFKAFLGLYLAQV